jgi:hypothetical protein
MHPIYETSYLGSKISVYPLRVVVSIFGLGEQTIPIAQIASIDLAMMGLMKITIETTGGKKYEIPCWKKKEVRDAIYRAQENLSAK